MAKSKSGKQGASGGQSSKAAAKELARLEKRLAKARDVESKRTRQAADAATEVAELTARIAGLANTPPVVAAAAAAKPAPAKPAPAKPAAAKPAAAKPAAAKPAAAKPAAASRSRTASRAGTARSSTARKPAAGSARRTSARTRRTPPAGGPGAAG